MTDRADDEEAKYGAVHRAADGGSKKKSVARESKFKTFNASIQKNGLNKMVEDFLHSVGKKDAVSSFTVSSKASSHAP